MRTARFLLLIALSFSGNLMAAPSGQPQPVPINNQTKFFTINNVRQIGIEVIGSATILNVVGDFAPNSNTSTLWPFKVKSTTDVVLESCLKMAMMAQETRGEILFTVTGE